nr:MAG TPA: hypothetical protein [Caudoviricetes sp.]
MKIIYLITLMNQMKNMMILNLKNWILMKIKI